MMTSQTTLFQNQGMTMTVCLFELATELLDRSIRDTPGYTLINKSKTEYIAYSMHSHYWVMQRNMNAPDRILFRADVDGIAAAYFYVPDSIGKFHEVLKHLNLIP